MLESLFNKVAGLEACKSIKRTLQRRCFPVNIAKFLRTAFSTLRTASGIETFFLVSDTYKLNLMISSSVGSSHPGKYSNDILMNTYIGKETYRGK